jgi:hypothetical protein
MQPECRHKQFLPAVGVVGIPTAVEFNYRSSIDIMWSSFMEFLHLRLCLSELIANLATCHSTLHSFRCEIETNIDTANKRQMKI